MKKILILQSGDGYTTRYLFPLLQNLSLLRDAGYVLLIDDFDLSCTEYDTEYLIVLHDCLESETAVVRREYLEKVKNGCRMLVWLDTSDSTGTTVFDVLPHVDLYLKKQLLKDVAQYATGHYNQRVFCDFYHRQFGICDPEPCWRQPLDLCHARKLRTAWNILIGDIWNDSTPHHCYHFAPGSRARKYDLSYRGSRSYTPTVSFQREKVFEMVGARSDLCFPGSDHIINHRCYMQQLAESRCVVSPFGWGEICWRDAECWISGCTLIKPDMSHLSTWPDYFIPHETYVPFSWDFADFGEILSGVRSAAYLEVAATGQEVYRRSISRAGMEAFISHFIGVLNEVTGAEVATGT